MRRFFITEDQKNNGKLNKEIVIDGSDRNHIQNVLRMNTGDSLLLCASDGTEFITVISGFSKDGICCKVQSVTENKTEPYTKIILIQGIPKGEKSELIIQKCVELGVFSVIPVITERVVVKFHDETDKKKKRERWQKISEEASKQSGRGIVPEIENIIKVNEVYSLIPENALKIIAYENEDKTSLKACLTEYIKDNFGPPEYIALIIGPEGGISCDELDQAVNNGFRPVSLGKRILRTETAGLSAIAGIRYELED